MIDCIQVVTTVERREDAERVARDQSDRGAVAQLNEFVYRPLQKKCAFLRERDGK